MLTLFFTSIDTFIAVLGLRVLSWGPVSGTRVGLTFVAGDALATFLGLLLRNTKLGYSLQHIAPFALSSYLLFVVLFTFGAVLGRMRLGTNVLWLALLLGLDNLFAAASGEISGVLAPALASGAAALAALKAGDCMSMRMKASWTVWTGAAMLAASILVR